MQWDPLGHVLTTKPPPYALRAGVQTRICIIGTFPSTCGLLFTQRHRAGILNARETKRLTTGHLLSVSQYIDIRSQIRLRSRLNTFPMSYERCIWSHKTLEDVPFYGMQVASSQIMNFIVSVNMVGPYWLGSVSYHRLLIEDISCAISQNPNMETTRVVSDGIHDKPMGTPCITVVNAGNMFPQHVKDTNDQDLSSLTTVYTFMQNTHTSDKYHAWHHVFTSENNQPNSEQLNTATIPQVRWYTNFATFVSMLVGNHAGEVGTPTHATCRVCNNQSAKCHEISTWCASHYICQMWFEAQLVLANLAYDSVKTVA